MSRRIDYGDRVVLKYCYPEVGDIEIEGIIVNIPGGAGALWEIEDDAGEVMAFNPYHYGFMGMMKAEEPTDE